MKKYVRPLAGLVVAAAAALWLPAQAGATEAQTGARPDVVEIPRAAFFPESIAAIDGTVFTSSITTGEIVRFGTRSGQVSTFVPPAEAGGLTTAGILADGRRGVLWACAIDGSFQRPTMLRAYDLSSGALTASYEVPDQGVCADITLARGDVYITDTTVPSFADPAGVQRPGRILRLRTADPDSATGGRLTVWSADPKLTGVNGLQINGISFDGQSTLYTTNYTSGELLSVRIGRNGAALPATVVAVDRALSNPDGIRMLDRDTLLVAENIGRLTAIEVPSGATRVLSDTVDQPSSVVRSGPDLWVSEGQILRLQAGQPPVEPFKIRRLPLP